VDLSNVTKVCNLDDIKNNNSLGVSIKVNGTLKKLIVVKSGKHVFAYVNSCPHTGAPLDLRPGQFLNHNKENIICSTHGALFQIRTGLCIFGPCKDKYLEAITIHIENNKILYVHN
jgi:nitrite reductase/ring-hydroxylating ferredoxin subunit